MLGVGWSGTNYKHGLMFHVQIKDGKVWIHEDRTDIDLASLLMEEGILRLTLFWDLWRLMCGGFRVLQGLRYILINSHLRFQMIDLLNGFLNAVLITSGHEWL